MKKVFTSVLALFITMLTVSSSVLVVFAEEKINYKSSMTNTFGTSKNIPTTMKGCYQFYFVIDDYNDYLILEELGLGNGQKETFFDNNILLVNFIINVTGTVEMYKNDGITKDSDSLCINYSLSEEGVMRTDAINYEIDYISLKKSYVKNVNLKKIKANLKIKYLPILSGSFKRDYSEEDRVLDMKYIDIKKLAKKPSQVKNIKAKSTKKKQLKVTWKKIKGTKYQVQYSLKKNMKNAKLKKNIKKNNVTLKKLKSNKKYYVRVRAYKKIGNKTYLGKWSKKAVKTVK